MTQKYSQNPSNRPVISQGKVPDISLNLSSQFVVHIFASALNSPRDLEWTPAGTLIVSSPSSNEVVALPDANHDGVADSKKVVLSGGHHLHGLAFYNNKLFVADVDRVVRYNWDENKLSATLDKVLFTLPANSDHNNHTIIFDKTGKMYVSVGSTCNICHEDSNLSGTVLVSDQNGASPQVFARGLRNAPFLQFNPTTQELWATEMGRDNLGDNMPSDEINIVKQGKDYGWPNCYGNKIHDTDFDKSTTDSCSATESPTYEIPAHSAPLGLAFINSSQFPENWQGDLLVAYHGSWNRSTPTGYKVTHLKVNGNTITSVEDFLTGFLPTNTKSGPTSAYGRPVDVTFDKNGSLFLSDDKAGNIYIIQKKP